MADCTEQKGLPRPDPNQPLNWRLREPPPYEQPPATLDTQENIQRAHQIAEAIDECATQVGLYEVMETVWTTEINDLINNDPDKAEPLVVEDIL